MVSAVGHLSGAHLNPAVSLAFAAGRHFPWREAGPYAAAQAAGALGASMCLWGLFGRGGGLGATRPAHVGDTQALALEAGLTAVLVVVILAVATDTRAVGQLAAVAIGATVALEALVFGPITGASMNPARSLAPALVEADLAHLWIYLAGPAAGALLGTAVYELMRGRPRPVVPATSREAP
jgi:MIP family channel proteins